MSFEMDKAMMELSLYEEDKPFNMPNLPQFKSSERNARSLIGRILNPECQKMANLILDMPRKWQKRGRVKGIALSKERFQFIFDHEHDLIEILEKEVHTFNDWTLAIDRWVEIPPPDYLRFIPIWVQIRNMPVNYYTEEAITALGDLIGEVKMVAFDPERSQTQEYVRVLVRFDVTRPLRKSKVVNLPEGGSTVVYFNYERIQKRCYECQRLNHAKDLCPLLVRKRQEQAQERRQKILMEKSAGKKILSEDDPLFGVLKEEQVGFCQETGRRKISPEVLDEMRRYMLTGKEEEKSLMIDRVRTSVAEVERDPLTQKTMLRLESKPVFTKDLDIGRGLVYDFDLNKDGENRIEHDRGGEKLMMAAIKANKSVASSDHGDGVKRTEGNSSSREQRSGVSGDQLGPSKDTGSKARSNVPLQLEGSPTEYGSGLFSTGPSGASPQQAKSRRRPYVKKRQGRLPAPSNVLQALYGNEEDKEKVGSKRRQMEEESSGHKSARHKEVKVIPHEGSPQF
ncbi:uncharacterized protein LOC108808612 [Raphanus sativus]|uniref:Uncharacterized protein LOC108808612 n=1 Tax=Raphanus sativus TaxID=3726 RepID=A0A6J0JKS8_RAPSA|nr:uncharacterized protein LOC108808612 [Raphanus sativus]